MIEPTQNGVEYTEVKAVSMGAIAIGSDIVYPPLKKPPSKEEFESHGIELSTGTREAGINLKNYDEMVERYKGSLKGWTRVVSKDSNRGIDNRSLIEFYKGREELVEKDEKEVRKYYEDIEKKKQQKT